MKLKKRFKIKLIILSVLLTSIASSLIALDSVAAAVYGPGTLNVSGPTRVQAGKYFSITLKGLEKNFKGNCSVTGDSFAPIANFSFSGSTNKFKILPVKTGEGIIRVACTPLVPYGNYTEFDGIWYLYISR